LQQSSAGQTLLETISSGSGYSFEDPNNNVMTQLHQEIYGVVQCGCSGNYVCDICGDGTITASEQCDPGSFCDDGTECTDDPSLCPSECQPRDSAYCTDTCVYPYCGDSYRQQPISAVCVDGQTRTCTT